MAILLAVLKFTGIAIAVLFVIAVLLLLAVLFVPVRYRIKGSLKEHTPDGSLRLT